MPSARAVAPRWLATWLPVCLVLLPVGVTLLDPGTTLFYRDHILAFRHLLRTTVEAWGALQLPLWNPWTGGGEPLLGDWNALATSPLLVTFLFDDFSIGYDLFVGIHLLIAGVGAVYMARALRMDGPAAATVAVAYVGSGIFLSFNNLLPAFEALAFAPWALGAAWWTWRAPGPAQVGALGLALALHAQFADPAFFVWDGLTFLAGVASLRRGGVRASTRAVGALFAGALVSIGVAALQLFPLLGQLQDTARGAGYSNDQMHIFALPSRRLFELGVPAFGGDYTRAINVYGPATDGRTYLVSLYSGASTLALAALGAVREGRARWFLAVGVLAVPMALGPATPLHGWLTDSIPLLDRSRYPVKHLVGLLFVLPLVAGFGVASLRTPVERRHAWAIAGCVALGLGLAAGVAYARGEDAAIEAMTSGAPISAAAGFGVVLVLATSIQGWAGAVRAAPFLVSLDLGLFAPFVFPVMPTGALQRPAVCEVLGGRGTPGYLLFEAYRTPAMADAADQVARARYSWERGFVGSASRCKVRHILDQDLSGRRPAAWASVWEGSLRAPPPVRRRVFRRLGIEVVGSEVRVVPPDEGRLLGEVSPTGGPPLYLQTLDGARPLVGLEPRTAPARGVTAFEALARPPPAQVGQVDEIAFEAGRVAARVRTSTAATLVVTQRYAEGWRARVNGVEVPPHRVDGLLIGVDIEAGDAEVVLEYGSTAAWAGAAVSLASLLCVGVMIVVWRRRPVERG